MEDNINNIDDEKILEELKCPICLELFDEPILELPNQHIFCKKCLYKSNDNINDDDNNNLICPICKVEINNLIIPRIILNLLNSIEMKCENIYNNKKCEFKGNVQLYYDHLKNNETHNEIELIKICEIMRKIIGKEITIHLKSKHIEIFNKYVQDWKWLDYLNRDWKWWWWANNPWWENKPCIECNNLWHKYENEVEIYEIKRISILHNFPSFQKKFVLNEE